MTQTAMAFAHFVGGRDDEAADWAATALRLKPNLQAGAADGIASNGMRGHADEAQRVLRAYLQIDPEVSIDKICGYYPFRRDVDRQQLIVGLRKAGVPE